MRLILTGARMIIQRKQVERVRRCLGDLGVVGVDRAGAAVLVRVDSACRRPDGGRAALQGLALPDGVDGLDGSEPAGPVAPATKDTAEQDDDNDEENEQRDAETDGQTDDHTRPLGCQQTNSAVTATEFEYLVG